MDTADQLIVVTCTVIDQDGDVCSTQVVGVFSSRVDAEKAADDYASDYRDENPEELPDDAFTYTVVAGDYGVWRPL
jgi:hypothetical protein